MSDKEAQMDWDDGEHVLAEMPQRQINANAVHGALGIDLPTPDEYPQRAVGEIGQLLTRLAQVRAELAQMQLDANAVCQSLNIKWARDGNYPDFAIQAIGKLRGKWARKEWERDEIRAELTRVRAELIDACTMRDALADEANELEESRDYNASLVVERDRELARLRKQLTTRFQRCGYCGYRATGADAFNLVAEHIKSCPGHPLAGALAELAQAKAAIGGLHVELADTCDAHDVLANKLKDLRGANQAYGQHLAAMKKNRDYWYETCLSTESALTRARQETRAQSDEVQRDWLSPAETEGLKRQLAKLREQLDKETTYSDRLFDKARRLEFERDTCNAQLTARLATLDALSADRQAAEAALADCGIGGIFAEFDGPADAINQMAQHIKELASRLMQVQADLDAESIEIDWEMAEALQAERRLRREAEQHTESFRQTILSLHRILDKHQVPRMRDRAGTIDRVLLLTEHATRAEALAQLVSEETAVLLERLSNCTLPNTFGDPYASRQCVRNRKDVRALAAKIREALALEVNDAKG